jgi:beta-lactamase regulating signal transducer with metallopeptidase domain
MSWSGALPFVNAAWQGLALVAGIRLAIRAFGLRRSASTVCAIWLVAFGLLTALPAIDAAAQRTIDLAAPTAEPALGNRGLATLAIRQPAAFAGRLGLDAARAVNRLAPDRALPVFLFAWALVSGVLVFRLAHGYAALFRLKRNAVPAPHLRALVPLADRRDTRVALSSEIGTACAAGFLRPMILLPQADVESLDRADLARIVAHEHGHLARFDDWTNAAMQAVCAVFFFFPALAIAARQVEIARECACDDVAIRRTGDRTAYARMLAAVVERAVNARRMATAPGFGASDVFGRVNHALDDHLDRRGGVSAKGVLFVLAVVGVAFGMARLGLPRIAHVVPVARPVVVVTEPSSGGALLAALVANGYAPVDTEVLVELTNHGISASDIIVLPNNDRSIADLIAIHDHGVSADLVRAIARVFPSSGVGDIIEFANHGLSAESVLGYAAADSSLSAGEMIDLNNTGVDPDFVSRLAQHGYRHLGVDKLQALHNAGFVP